MLAAATIVTAAFSPQPLTPQHAPVLRASPAVSMTLLPETAQTRRGALLTGASLAALTAVPSLAFADANEDAMAAIAARTNAKNEEAKAKKEAEVRAKAAKLQAANLYIAKTTAGTAVI